MFSTWIVFVFLTHYVFQSLKNVHLFKRMVGHFGFGNVLMSGRQSDMHVMPSMNLLRREGVGLVSVFIHLGTGNQAFGCTYRL